MDRPPRLRPAAVAGLGAGGSLGAAAICIFALGVASVAFVPWGPPPRLAERSPPLVTLRAPRPQPPAPPPRRPRRATPHPVAATTPAPQRASAPAARIEGRRRRRPRPPATAPPAPAPEPAPASPPPPPAAPPPDPPPTLLRDHVVAAAGHARALGEQAATTVSQVSPEAGALVAQTSGTVASTVEDVATRLP